MTYDKWFNACCKYAQECYGIGRDIGIHGEFFRRMYRADKTVQDAVDRFGYKYNLTDLGELDPFRESLVTGDELSYSKSTTTENANG